MLASLSEGSRLPTLMISTVNNIANAAGSIHGDTAAAAPAGAGCRAVAYA